MVKLLEVKNCLDCPYHTTVRDPSSDDSFDAFDDALVCTKASRRYKHEEEENARRFGWPACRVIVGASRNAEREYEKNGAEIPKWCPLKTKE